MSTSPSTAKTYGIAFMLLSGLLLSSHDGLSKYLSEFYTIVFILWVRYWAQTGIMVVSFAPRLGKRLLKTDHLGWQVLRGLLLIGNSLLFVTGLRYLPLAEATGVIFLAPMMVMVVSALYGEYIRPAQWILACVGLGGVLLIVRPGGDVFSSAALYPFAAAICFTAYQFITRRLARTDHAATTNFYTSLVGALAMTVAVPFFWQEPKLFDLGLMFILGVLAMGAHFLLTKALGYTSAAELAPFTYMQIIFAGVIGWLAYGHVPDSWALVGMALVVLSGMASAYIQRRLT